MDLMEEYILCRIETVYKHSIINNIILLNIVQCKVFLAKSPGRVSHGIIKKSYGRPTR